jgi:uncharacterized membrane protein (UPF0127 family)
MRILAVVLAAGLLMAACGERGAHTSMSPTPACEATPPPDAPSFDQARALLEGEEGSVLITVEVAERPEQHAFGLMERDCLPEDHGMVFVFFEDTTTGFYMYRTKIPLSIAFFDVDGEIVDIIDMEPCTSDQPAECEIYQPDSPYRGALEVNQGAFERWGVGVGDHIRLVR